MRVEHFGYLGAVARHQGQVQPQPRAARAPGRRGRRQPLPALQPRLRVRRRRRRRPRPDALRARLDRPCAAPGASAATATRRRWPRATSTRCATPAACDDVASVGDEVLELFPGFTDIVLEQALAARAGDADAPGGAAAPLPGDGRRARAATRRPSAAAPTAALVALAEVLRRRGAVEEAEETLRGCLREHPGFLAAVDPYAALLLRRGVPGRRGRRDRPRAGGRLEPEHALPARRRAERGRRRRRGRGRAARACSTPSPATRTRASRWPRRCWPRAATPTPPPSRRGRRRPRRPAPPPPSGPSSSPC